MSSDRISHAIKALTQDTVLGDFVEPIVHALDRVRYNSSIFNAISMEDFITLGVHRLLQANQSLREMVQQLMHDRDAELPPVARSTFSDALASARRRSVLRSIVPPLVTQARALLPDHTTVADNMPVQM